MKMKLSRTRLRHFYIRTVCLFTHKQSNQAQNLQTILFATELKIISLSLFIALIFDYYFLLG